MDERALKSRIINQIEHNTIKILKLCEVSEASWLAGPTWLAGYEMGSIAYNNNNNNDNVNNVNNNNNNDNNDNNLSLSNHSVLSPIISQFP